MKKPKCRLNDGEGNVSKIIARVLKTLKNAGQNEKADEFRTNAVWSVNEILALCADYVEIEYQESALQLKEMKTNRSKLKTGWKVFKVYIEGNRTVLSSAMGRGKLTCYDPGKLIRRESRCGPFAVFRDRRSARKFADGLNRENELVVEDYQRDLPRLVFKVQFLPSKEHTLYYVHKWPGGSPIHVLRSANPGVVFKGRFGKYENVGLGLKDHQRFVKYPRGTCFADAVYLPWSSVQGSKRPRWEESAQLKGGA